MMRAGARELQRERLPPRRSEARRAARGGQGSAPCIPTRVTHSPSPLSSSCPAHRRTPGGHPKPAGPRNAREEGTDPGHAVSVPPWPASRVTSNSHRPTGSSVTRRLGPWQTPSRKSANRVFCTPVSSMAVRRFLNCLGQGSDQETEPAVSELEVSTLHGQERRPETQGRLL